MTQAIQVPPSLRKSKPLRGCALSREDLLQLYQLLQSLVDEAGDLEVLDYQVGEGQTDVQLQETKDLVKDMFKVFVRIETEKGATTSQASEDVFTKPDMPVKVSRIEFDGGFIFRERVKQNPRNQVYVLLDFRNIISPTISVQPAQATPNDSQFVLAGEDDKWVRAAHSKVEEFFENKIRKGMWVHNAGTYDLFLMTIGIIFVAWVLNFFVPHIDNLFVGLSKIYSYASYIFVFLAALRFFMFMFDYARVMWPIMELKGANPVAVGHRWIWAMILVTVIGGIIKDLLF